MKKKRHEIDCWMTHLLAPCRSTSIQKRSYPDTRVRHLPPAADRKQRLVGSLTGYLLVTNTGAERSTSWRLSWPSSPHARFPSWLVHRPPRDLPVWPMAVHHGTDALPLRSEKQRTTRASTTHFPWPRADQHGSQPATSESAAPEEKRRFPFPPAHGTSAQLFPFSLSSSPQAGSTRLTAKQSIVYIQLPINTQISRWIMQHLKAFSASP